MNNKLKVVAYLRYSDSKQDGNHSLEIQKNRIQFLADRENLQVMEWRTDKATSAYHGNAGNRKGIKQVIEDIENGAAGICFYEESRLTRSINDFYNDVYLPIKESYPDTRFFSTQSEGEWNPNDPIVQTKLVMAAEESEIKSTRAKDAQKKILTYKEPKRPGSRPPIGYDMQDGVLYPNEDAQIVRLIFHLASWGHSNKIIADYLNKCEITAKRVTHWNSSTIGYILSNKAYSGTLAWDVRTSFENSRPKPDEEIKLFKDVHEPIISPTINYLVKQMMDFKNMYGAMSTPYYLRGIIKCKGCMTLLVAKDNSPKGKSGLYMIYKCPECKKTVPIIPVHQAVLDDLQRKWASHLSTFMTTAKQQLNQWNRQLSKAKSDEKQKLERAFYNEKIMKASMENDSFLKEAFLTAQQHIQNNVTFINQTTEEINTLLDDDYLTVFLKELIQKSFYDFSDTELRVFFLIYFEEIIINFNKKNEIQISYRLSPFVSLENITGQLTEQAVKKTNPTG